MVDHSKHGNLRKHQIAALSLAARVVKGQFHKRKAVACVTPGGGKTLMCSLFAHYLLDAGFVDEVWVVVPRKSLRHQMIDGFTVIKRGLTKRLTDFESRTRGQRSVEGESHGLVTTYQFLLKPENVKRLMKRAKDKRILLVLDESHHMAEDGAPAPDTSSDEETDGNAWREAVKPIVDAARFTLLMSGTLNRHQRGERCAFVDYKPDTREAEVDILYTRRDALLEQSITKVCFELLNVSAEWFENDERQSALTGKASSRQLSRALRATLANKSMVDATVIEKLGIWREYKSTVFPKSKAIVVVHNQATAKRLKAIIERELKVQVALAISDNSDAQVEIAKYRNDLHYDVLVTVGMAYEGLDVPQATHLICLTNVRSTPWLEQVINRVTRHCHDSGIPWHAQEARVWLIEDKPTVDFINDYMNDQLAAYELSGSAGTPPTAPGYVKFRAGETEVREVNFALHTGLCDKADSMRLQRLRADYPKIAVLPFDEQIAIARKLYPDAAE